jgi:predicted anti-sigma-YlaC factor YlaD
MSACPNEDLLLRIGAAVDWDVEGTLRHVSRCARCAETLAELGTLRAMLTEAHAPDPGFSDEVMRTIEAEERAPIAVTAALRARLPLTPLRYLCATVIAFAVLMVGGGVQGGAATPAGPALAMALLAGLAAVWTDVFNSAPG